MGYIPFFPGLTLFGAAKASKPRQRLRLQSLRHRNRRQALFLDPRQYLPQELSRPPGGYLEFANLFGSRGFHGHPNSGAIHDHFHDHSRLKLLINTSPAGPAQVLQSMSGIVLGVLFIKTYIKTKSLHEES